MAMKELFAGDNQTEDGLILMGRVNALAAYVRGTHYPIDREIIAAMLGFELDKEEKE